MSVFDYCILQILQDEFIGKRIAKGQHEEYYSVDGRVLIPKIVEGHIICGVEEARYGDFVLVLDNCYEVAIDNNEWIRLEEV